MNDNYPRPGSPGAVSVGCKCPILDNARGKGSGRVDSKGQALFWINGSCPIHGIKASEEGGQS